jgi:hypothetical protein
MPRHALGKEHTMNRLIDIATVSTLGTVSTIAIATGHGRGAEGAVFLTSRRKLAIRIASLGLAAGTFLVPASNAWADPAATHFVVVNDPQTFTGTAFCLPEGKIGTVVTQEISVGTSVATRNGVVVTGVDEFTFRVDFPDGSRVEAGIDRDHFQFVGNGANQVFTRVTQDFETIYNAAGDAVGKIMVNATLHTSWRDTNRDGVPDEGELTTQVDNFRLRCS